MRPGGQRAPHPGLDKARPSGGKRARAGAQKRVWGRRRAVLGSRPLPWVRQALGLLWPLSACPAGDPCQRWELHPPGAPTWRGQRAKVA